MRNAAVLALLALVGCRIVGGHACPDIRPTMTCADAQEAFARDRVAHGVYGHCGTEIRIRDGGAYTVPDRCALHALCDGGFCPDASMGIE